MSQMLCVHRGDSADLIVMLMILLILHS